MTWDSQTVWRVILKAALLFGLTNLAFAVFDPIPALGRISLYNKVYPGRQRLPYGDNPALSYNLSPNDLNTMFAVHEVARPKPNDEFRVLVLGDSSVWGFLLRPTETLSAQINAAGLRWSDGRAVRAYNLGYPIMSLTKDLLLLNEGLRFAPDLVVWVVTLESFPRDKQLGHPLVRNNAGAVRSMINRYALALDPTDPALVERSFWDRTLVGRRRDVADWLRLQLYGLLWAATGVDQYYPETYEPAQRDLEADVAWHGLRPPSLPAEALALDVLAAGVKMSHEAGAEVLLVNEPILISAGRNSDVRYNFFYPRWAYDDYRRILRQWAEAHQVRYLDAWDAVPEPEFTDSAVHLTPKGTRLFAERLLAVLRPG
ncbi:MAG: SGNH/GDSL hydrolase family protein [Anaerolineae bacterium]|nr:SGNH/GDSL hydrolase family protein [Anaerolineae bacterium]